MQNISIFDLIDEIEPFEETDPMTWCAYCLHEVKGCCDYNEPLGRTCVLGSGFKKKEGAKE